MTRITIAVPDALAPHIKAAAGGNVSAWLSDLARDALLRQAGAAVAEYEASHADPAWDAEREREWVR
jgi:hypothetical protein